MDIKALSSSQLLDNPGYSSRIDQFYLENKGKYILEVGGHADQKTQRKERETPGHLAPLFIHLFFSPWGCPM